MKKAIITLFSALSLTACRNNQPTNIQNDIDNTTINPEPPDRASEIATGGKESNEWLEAVNEEEYGKLEIEN